MLETALGARGEGDLRALVDHALRLKYLMGFVPRRYDAQVIEQMALSGSLEPRLDHATRAGALAYAAERLGMGDPEARRSEEHTSELQSLMLNSYAVFCLT